MLQEMNKLNHGHCLWLRTQIPIFFSLSLLTSGHMFKTHCIKEWFIFRHIKYLKSVENKRDFWGFSSSLVLGCKAPWTSLLLSCKNTRTDHDSSDLDKDKQWNCTSEMKFLIAAKPIKWLAAIEKSSSIQVCPNWHCYSINYSAITYFLWWGLFSSSSACHVHQKNGNAWPRKRGRSRMISLLFFFFNGKLQALWLHYKAVLHKRFPLNAPICSWTICVPASTVIQPTLNRINA